MAARPAWGKLWGTSLGVTGVVAVCARIAPSSSVAVVVAAVFLGAAWWLAWRHDDACIVEHGLSLGGLALRSSGATHGLFGRVLRATTWALVAALVTFVPFYFGWKAVWHPTSAFRLRVAAMDLLGETSGQLVLVALPEEAFYRGYVQTAIFSKLQPRSSSASASATSGRWLGVTRAEALALVLTSALFALGHIATVARPARLAVFFPSLLFGWLRMRTGGIGASVAFHAMCNLFSEAPGRGFHLYD